MELREGKLVLPPTVEGLRHTINLLWKMLQKERQRNKDLKKRIEELTK